MNDQMAERFAATRRFTEYLCEPLVAEDFVVQSMPAASPTRWHLAHTTWFFETFVLSRWESDYHPFSRQYQFLFNSYYNSVGEPFPRQKRGLLTRPTVAEVFGYRRSIDARMERLLEQSSDAELVQIAELGLNHEQQHQELILTDIKHMLSCNPLWPVYRSKEDDTTIGSAGPAKWLVFEGGLTEIGHSGVDFSFDNERPRHHVFLAPFELQDRLVTCGEYLRFMAEDGYRRPELWLSLGWTAVCEEGLRAPLYWVEQNGHWCQFTLAGLQPIENDEPVAHLSYFEADAFARWAGARLPTEAEWERAACELPIEGTFVEAGCYHPRKAAALRDSPAQMFGELWQWTQSPYASYPGYVAPAGALGEYNGKFMCNQYVLRGGSCATPAGHIRSTFRNFFPPETRWQFSGVRLARDVAR